MNSPMQTRVKDYKDENGYWSEYPGFPIEDWQSEVANGDTKQGYWEWVSALQEEDATV